MRSTQNHLGANVAYLVETGKATRAELAAQLGISVQAVGKLIRGETGGFKPLNLVNAAKFLGFTVEDLVCRDLRRDKKASAKLTTSEISVLDWLKTLPTEYKPAEKGEIRSALDQLQMDMQDGGRTAVKAARIVNLLYAEA